jgi:thioesterase domain-containing protein
VRRPFAPPPATTLGEIYRRAIESYVPPPYAGRVLLLRAANGGREAGLGWRRIAGTLTVQAVPGDHATCVTTHAEALVKHLRASLDEAQRERAR